MFFILWSCEHFAFIQGIAQIINDNPNYPNLISDVLSKSPPVSKKLKEKITATLPNQDMHNSSFSSFPLECLQKLSQDCIDQCRINYYNLRLLYLRCRLHIILEEQNWPKRVRGKALLILSLAKGDERYTAAALLLLSICEERPYNKVIILNEALKCTQNPSHKNRYLSDTL